MSSTETGVDGDVPEELLFKVIIVGDAGTGKTSIVKRYVHNVFSLDYKSTIGVDFAMKVIHWDTNTIVRLQLWDIAGQERFGKMTRVFYKEAVGGFVVYDVTRPSTFEGAITWKEDIDEKVFLPDDKPIPVVLLCNKSDLAKDGMVKTEHEMEAFVKDHNFVGWFLTSAKENTNINKAATELVSHMLPTSLGSNTTSGEKGLTLKEEEDEDGCLC